MIKGFVVVTTKPGKDYGVSRILKRFGNTYSLREDEWKILVEIEGENIENLKEIVERMKSIPNVIRKETEAYLSLDDRLREYLNKPKPFIRQYSPRPQS